MGLGRAATSVVANEEGSCWSTILWEDASSCGKITGDVRTKYKEFFFFFKSLDVSCLNLVTSLLAVWTV